MDNDFSLSGLDPASAREFVLQHIIALKNTQKQRQRLAEDLTLWSGRSALAAEKGREDLRDQALLKCREIAEQDDVLAAEERALASDIDRMKQELEVLKRQPTPTVDADLLLAQLEQVVGEKDMTASRFRDAEAEMALEELKRNLGSKSETDDDSKE